MKKVFLVISVFLMLMGFAFAEKKGSYKVTSIVGKVTYEVSNGVWADLKVGMTLDADDNVNVGLNSSLEVDLDGETFSIKPMKKGKVLALTTGTAKTGVKVGSRVTKADIAQASTNTTKGTATASSRASSAKADIEWED